MTIEEFKNIFTNVSDEWTGDNCFKGLQIIAKYTDNIVQGAGHDEVRSENVQVLIESGITKEDAIALRKLNWMISGGCLSCFV